MAAQIAKMRTIDGSFKEIKEKDPNSSISKHFLRQLAKSGKIKVVKAGNRYLLDMNELNEYLSNPPEEYLNENDVAEYGKLRRIKA